MSVTDHPDTHHTDNGQTSESDRFDSIALAVTQLHGEIQEMRRDLRRMANQLLAGLVELAKE